MNLPAPSDLDLRECRCPPGPHPERSAL